MAKQIRKDKNKSIGVIGFGNLGARLTAQILLSGHKVIVFDSNIEAGKRNVSDKAVDPAVTTNGLDRPLVEESALAILKYCNIVHWAVQSAKLNELPPVPSNCVVILHDSVMANSAMALSQREDKGRFVVAHCLMNDARRVLVSSEFGNRQMAGEHFVNIGLAPKFITVEQHDTLMARTQGVFALVIELGIREELDRGFAAGDLTPSAMELREAVVNREANWTKPTPQSILRNPELIPFAKEITDLLASRPNGL